MNQGLAGRVTPAAHHGLMADMEFKERQAAMAVAWKQATAVLPDEARAAAPYVDKDGSASGPMRDVCLPIAFAEHNLLPQVRALALELFAELGIPWHAGVLTGPSNHLLSSQVQCVNALGRMVNQPELVKLAFGSLLDTDEVLQVEPGRWLTFEFIGSVDRLGEAVARKRVRGAHCTSVDAAFLHRTTAGVVELVLVEWKYTESYSPRDDDPRKNAVRRKRYEHLLVADDSPVDGAALPFHEFLHEPLYQLMRQQLLAHELEKHHELGADVVRVVHAQPTANAAYQASLSRPSHRELGATVDEVWHRLLRRPDRFTLMDSARFLDPAITSDDYVARYDGSMLGDA